MVIFNSYVSLSGGKPIQIYGIPRPKNVSARVGLSRSTAWVAAIEKKKTQQIKNR